MTRTCTYVGILLYSLLGFKGVCQELPKVIPPSPETAALFKFQDYPVDYCTGLPQVSIPIYQVTSGSLSLPITLSYHSSGRKVYDETGSVGLGWTLQAGGMISRTIYGYPDDERWGFPSPWRSAAELSNRYDFLFLAAVGHHPYYGFDPYYETQYDIFSYSVNNLSGKFILKDVDNAKTARLIPEKPYKIGWHKIGAPFQQQYFDYMEITDDKGVLYRFGNKERSENGVTGWMLTEMVSADKMDTISFKYKGFTGERKSVSQKSTITEHRYQNRVEDMNYEVSEEENTNYAYYSMLRLAEISFKQGKVIFGLDIDNKVTSIEIRNRRGEILKNVTLSRSRANAISDGIAPVDKLDYLAFKDKFGKVTEKYNFEYYPTSDIDVRACDMWGYHNGANNPSGVINMRPFTILPPPIIGGVSTAVVDFNYNARPPSLTKMLNGVLKKITYPTGGTTAFTYELNQFFHPQTATVKPGAGLRIAQIETTDNNGTTSFQTYKYGENENNYGFLNIVPSAENIQDYTRYQNFDDGAGGPVSAGSYTLRTVSSDILPVFSYVSQKPIIYTHVTQYHGTLTDNIGKTVYKYDFDDRIAPQSVDALFRFSKYRFWRTPELRERSEFKSQKDANNNISYTLQKQTKYNYIETETEVVNGLHYKKKYVCSSPNEPVHYTSISTGQTKSTGIDQMVAEEWSGGQGGSGPFGVHDWEIYTFGDYGISIGYKELTTVEETEVFDAGQLTTLTHYVYNDKRLIKETRKQINANETRVTEVKYPSDFPEVPVHQEMINRNMVNYEIEVNTYSNSTPLTSIKYNFKDWGNNIIKPENISSRTGTNPYESRVTFHSYDERGNIQTVSKDNGPRMTYLYGYNDRLPVCEALNANRNEIFYTSFEDGDGNSGENDAKTGRKSKIDGFTYNLTGLTNGAYRLSYWKKTTGVWQLLTVNDITVTNGTYPISLSGQIDEVRFSPSNSLLTTLTYEPLEGTLSSTDKSNVTTYYDYDGYQRLMKVKDANRHLLMEFEYHYKD